MRDTTMTKQILLTRRSPAYWRVTYKIKLDDYTFMSNPVSGMRNLLVDCGVDEDDIRTDEFAGY